MVNVTTSSCEEEIMEKTDADHLNPSPFYTREEIYSSIRKLGLVYLSLLRITQKIECVFFNDLVTVVVFIY